jgi:hypothetical protein
LEILLPNVEQGLVMLNNEINAADSGINVWAESTATFSARTLKSIKLARGVGRNAVEEPPKIAPKSYPFSATCSQIQRHFGGYVSGLFYLTLALVARSGRPHPRPGRAWAWGQISVLLAVDKDLAGHNLAPRQDAAFYLVANIALCEARALRGCVNKTVTPLDHKADP